MIIIVFFIFFFRTSSAGGGGGALPGFFFTPCSADHKQAGLATVYRIFFRLATNALNKRKNNNYIISTFKLFQQAHFIPMVGVGKEGRTVISLW